MHRIALAVARAASSGSEQRDASGETAPRTYVFDDAFGPVWDEGIIPASDTSRMPTWWRMAGEIQRRQADCDAIVTWGEKLSLALLMRQAFARGGRPHVAMMYQFEKPNIRLPLSAFKKHLHAVVTWSSVQRRALIDRVGYPADRVYLIRHYVDQVFYTPRVVESDMICAVGAEMRDYGTLIEALRGSGIRCHIAAGHVRVPRRLRLLNDRRVAIDHFGIPPTGAALTASRLSLIELRELYARSRFAVVPLLPSDTDNGVTCILEAMAMGKPVICSRTKGQVDVIQEGVTGLYVPVGDARALRAAIQSLWNDPDRTLQMGRNARAYVEKAHTLERFTATVRSAAEAALEGRPAPEGGWE